MNSICEKTEDKFEWTERWLSVWAESMRKRCIDLRYPHHSVGVSSSSWGYKDIIDKWEGEVNNRAINIINAHLEDAQDCEKEAVYHVHFGDKYKGNGDVDIVYKLARQKIGVRLRKADFF